MIFIISRQYSARHNNSIGKFVHYDDVTFNDGTALNDDVTFHILHGMVHKKTEATPGPVG